MTDQKPKKPRMPNNTLWCRVGVGNEARITSPLTGYTMQINQPSSARRIAAWLLKWADWKEARRD